MSLKFCRVLITLYYSGCIYYLYGTVIKTSELQHIKG